MTNPHSIEHEGYTIRPQNTTVKGHKYERYAVDFGTDAKGNRKRRTFKSVAKAKSAIREHLATAKSNAEAQARMQSKIGEKAQDLSADDLLDAARALEILKGRGSLTVAAGFFVAHTIPEGGEKRTIAELVKEYADSKEKANRSPFTVRDIRDMLKPFALAFDKINVAEITTAEIEGWYEDQNGGPGRMLKRRNHLVSMFKYAIKRKYCQENPASAIDAPQKTKATVHVLTVKDADALMHYAEKNESDMVPYLALCLFGGLRPMGEAGRLDWKDIDFSRREVFVSDAVSKTGDERIIEMNDTLAAWLAPYRQTEGAIFYTRSRFENIRKGAKVRWAKDILRHSFGSYHLAMFDNMGKTMELMGHTNARILKNHYRRAIRKEDAAAFWAILPEVVEDENLRKFPKAS